MYAVVMYAVAMYAAAMCAAAMCAAATHAIWGSRHMHGLAMYTYGGLGLLGSSFRPQGILL